MKNYTTFKHPYVLIEDSKGKLQPIYKEYEKELPRINLDSPTLCCPFSNARRSSKPKKKPTIKPGYCEICYTKFEDYNLHVKSKEHREYAEDESNYRKIDAFIAEMAEVDYECLRDAMNSPCDRLEAELALSNVACYSNHSDTECFIRFSHSTTDADNDVVPFDLILEKIDKNVYREN